MRLTSDEIEFISAQDREDPGRRGAPRGGLEPRLVEGIGRVITDELAVEDRLNDEVREVLVQHSIEMERPTSPTPRCSRW